MPTMTVDEKRTIVMEHALTRAYNELLCDAPVGPVLTEIHAALGSGVLDHMARVLGNLRDYAASGAARFSSATLREIDAALNYQPATCARCGVTLDTRAGIPVHDLCPDCRALWQATG